MGGVVVRLRAERSGCTVVRHDPARWKARVCAGRRISRIAPGGPTARRLDSCTNSRAGDAELAHRRGILSKVVKSNVCEVEFSQRATSARLSNQGGMMSVGKVWKGKAVSRVGIQIRVSPSHSATEHCITLKLS